MSFHVEETSICECCHEEAGDMFYRAVWNADETTPQLDFLEGMDFVSLTRLPGQAES